MQDKHLIVKKYLEEHSLVESNVTSFNNFIEKRMQEIVNEISETIVNDEFEIVLGRIKVGKPNVIESDGSSSLIMPYEARLRNLTYSAPITLELTIKKEGQIDSDEVEIGRIPIMVGSNRCNTSGFSKNDLIKNYKPAVHRRKREEKSSLKNLLVKRDLQNTDDNLRKQGGNFRGVFFKV